MTTTALKHEVPVQEGPLRLSYHALAYTPPIRVRKHLMSSFSFLSPTSTALQSLMTNLHIFQSFNLLFYPDFHNYLTFMEILEPFPSWAEMRWKNYGMGRGRGVEGLPGKSGMWSKMGLVKLLNNINISRHNRGTSFLSNNGHVDFEQLYFLH